MQMAAHSLRGDKREAHFDYSRMIPNETSNMMNHKHDIFILLVSAKVTAQVSSGGQRLGGASSFPFSTGFI